MKVVRILSCQVQGCNGVAWTPAGDPFWVTRYPGGPGAPARYACARCERGYVITPIEFNRLPAAGPEQLGPRVTAHISASHALDGALTRGQAFYLFTAGFTRADVEEMASDPPREIDSGRDHSVT